MRVAIRSIMKFENVVLVLIRGFNAKTNKSTIILSGFSVVACRIAVTVSLQEDVITPRTPLSDKF